MLAERHDSGLAAYDALATSYDAFTADHDYDGWTDSLERLAFEHGLRGRRLLDVACGTGKSFIPFLRKGYEVTACDLSPAMVEQARAKAHARGATVLCADMRELPELGAHDLVTCLDDALNYLLGEDELVQCFTSLRRQLARDGVLVFDVNTLHAYRTAFAISHAVERPGLICLWRGTGSGECGRGAIVEALVDCFQVTAEGLWTRATGRHVQRHRTAAEVADALVAAGLTPLATRGMTPDGAIHPSLDEDVHHKAIFVACLPRDTERR